MSGDAGPVDPAGGRRAPSARGTLAGVSLGGGALALVAGAVSLLVGLGFLAASGPGDDLVPLTVGEPVPAPVPEGFGDSAVVVYGERYPVAGASVTEAMGCVVLDADGREQAGLRDRADPGRTADGRTLVSLVSTSEVEDGDSIVCRGPGAASAGELSVGTGTGANRTAGLLALAFGVLALVVGTGFVVVGLAARAGRRS